MGSINFSDSLKVRVDSRQNIQGDFGSLGLPSGCLYDLSQNITSLKGLENEFKDKAMQKAFDCIERKNLTISERKSLISPTGKIYSFFTLEPHLKFNPVDRTFNSHFGRTYFDAEEYKNLAKRNFGVFGIYNQNFTSFYLQSTNASALLQRIDGNALGQTQDLGMMVMRGDCFLKNTSLASDVSSSPECLNSDVTKMTGIGIGGIAVGAIATALLVKACGKKAPQSPKLSCKFENGASPKVKILISDPTPAPVPDKWSCVLSERQKGISHARLIESSSSEGSDYDSGLSGTILSGNSDHDQAYVEMNPAIPKNPIYEEIKPVVYDTPKSPSVPIRKEHANVTPEEIPLYSVVGKAPPSTTP
ncbi:MAG: hypothetical protein ACRCYZ_03305 [Alphaproteobacteria bacterium]